MISFREKLVTNERTNRRTNGSEFIGPTSKVGGSNKQANSGPARARKNDKQRAEKAS